MSPCWANAEFDSAARGGVCDSSSKPFSSTLLRTLTDAFYIHNLHEIYVEGNHFRHEVRATVGGPRGPLGSA